MYKRYSYIFVFVLTLFCGVNAGFGQATWSGAAGSGDWLDGGNWTGGSGPGGIPGAGQGVTLPATTAGVTVDGDAVAAAGSVANISQQGGVLAVGDNGNLGVTGNLRIGDTANGTGLTVVNGALTVGGGIDVAFGDGSGGTSSEGQLQILSPSFVRVAGNLDTWWDANSSVSVNGPAADVEIGGLFYIGPGATIDVNVNADQFMPIRSTNEIQFVGGAGTLNVNFTDRYQPTLGTSWTLMDAPTITNQAPIVNLPAPGTGLQALLTYETGGQGQVVNLSLTNTLNLLVDSTLGTASIENPIVGGDPIDIDGYIIRSASGALDEGAFQGLGEAGWLPGLSPSQSSTLISESSFGGSAAVATGESFSLGSIFDPTGTQDLSFEFHVAGGDTRAGTVSYMGVTAPLCDFDGDGVCDITDLDALLYDGQALQLLDPYDLNSDGAVDLLDRDEWYSSASLENGVELVPGDTNLDGRVVASDLNDLGRNWQRTDATSVAQGDFDGNGLVGAGDLNEIGLSWQFGVAAAANASAVPEPSSLALGALGLGGFFMALRRRRG